MGNKLMDQYSLLHFSAGVIAYFFGIDFWVWFVIHLVFEIIENTECGMHIINKLSIWPGGKNYADSFINLTGDQIFAMLGWYVAYKLDNIGNERGWFKKHL